MGGGISPSRDTWVVDPSFNGIIVVCLVFDGSVELSTMRDVRAGDCFVRFWYSKNAGLMGARPWKPCCAPRISREEFTRIVWVSFRV